MNAVDARLVLEAIEHQVRARDDDGLDCCDNVPSGCAQQLEELGFLARVDLQQARRREAFNRFASTLAHSRAMSVSDTWTRGYADRIQNSQCLEVECGPFSWALSSEQKRLIRLSQPGNAGTRCMACHRLEDGSTIVVGFYGCLPHGSFERFDRLPSNIDTLVYMNSRDLGGQATRVDRAGAPPARLRKHDGGLFVIGRDCYQRSTQVTACKTALPLLATRARRVVAAKRADGTLRRGEYVTISNESISSCMEMAAELNGLAIGRLVLKWPYECTLQSYWTRMKDNPVLVDALGERAVDATYTKTQRLCWEEAAELLQRHAPKVTYHCESVRNSKATADKMHGLHSYPNSSSYGTAVEAGTGVESLDEGSDDEQGSEMGDFLAPDGCEYSDWSECCLSDDDRAAGKGEQRKRERKPASSETAAESSLVGRVAQVRHTRKRTIVVEDEEESDSSANAAGATSNREERQRRSQRRRLPSARAKEALAVDQPGLRPNLESHRRPPDLLTKLRSVARYLEHSGHHRYALHVTQALAEMEVARSQQ